MPQQPDSGCPGGDSRAGEGGYVPSTIDLIEGEIPRLRRYARYLAREADRADDLVQECLMRAIAKIDSWTPGTNLRAWLFVILRNCHINEIRRGQRISPLGETNNEYDVVPTPAGQEAHISLLEVRDAYLNLSEEHREVLLLVAIEGLQYEEAAGILEVPVGTIRSRLSRARQALRDALEEGPGNRRGGLGARRLRPWMIPTCFPSRKFRTTSTAISTIASAPPSPPISW